MAPMTIPAAGLSLSFFDIDHHSSGMRDQAGQTLI
jgi:hypothetical protein